jgi:hypothetical protein
VFESFEALLTQYTASASVPCRQGRRTYASHVTTNPPASALGLANLETWVGAALPADYRSFLARWNGASLFAIEKGHHPSFYSCADVPGAQAHFDDPRIVVIGQSDDEGYFLLDRRELASPTWPLYWADELQPIDELLDVPALAPGFAAFLDAFIAAQGEWFWQRPPVRPWIWQMEQPNWWTHGSGATVRLESGAHPLQPRLTYAVMFGLGTTPPGLLLAAGVRDHLLALGAESIDPRSVGWSVNGWFLAFPPSTQPMLDPAQVQPSPVGDAWREVAPHLWVFGNGLVGLMAERQALRRGAELEVSRVAISWRLGPGDSIAIRLRETFSRYTSHETWPEYLPDGYEAVILDFWRDRPHQIRPDE